MQEKALALVTGASGGIGLELAKVLAENGHPLLLVARRADRLEKIKAELEAQHKVKVSYLAQDLNLPDAAENLRSFARQRGLEIGILVNNAGMGDYQLFHRQEWAKLETMLDLNVKALTRMTHAFLPDMLARGRGRVLNLASVLSFMPSPVMAVYAATKAYVLAFSEALDNETRGKGVTITALCPGPTESEFFDVANMRGVESLERLPVASARSVAEFGYKALSRGQGVAVHGMSNKVLAKSFGLMPKPLRDALLRMMGTPE